MTYFHYYASTTRNLADVFKYGVYPFSQAMGYIIAQKCGIKGEQKYETGAKIARWFSAVAYMGLSSTFFALESEMIDANLREAVATEMGIDPEKLKFSDYAHSHNKLASKAYHDIIGLQKYRFGTDLLFVLPDLIIKPLSKAAGVDWSALEISETRIREDHDNKIHPSKIFFNGHNVWSSGIYAGKALYWAGETFGIKKTGHYELVKLRENLQSTGKDVSANDMLAIYQRTRTDRKLPMIESKPEFDALRPLLQRMATEYNKREGFSVAEIVYLVGLGKINIHAEDGKTLSTEAVAQSEKEIDKVVKLGLDGIREENKKHREQAAKSGKLPRRSTSFTEGLTDTAFSTSQALLHSVTGKRRHFKPEEYISIRDPGEIVSMNVNNASR